MPPVVAVGGGLALAGGGTAAAGGGIAISGTTAAWILGGTAVVAGTAYVASNPDVLPSIGSSSTATAGAPTANIPALTPQQRLDRLAKIREIAKGLTAAAARSCATGNCCHRTVVISKSRSPLSAKHIEEAQAEGFPSTLTIDRAGASARRAASLSGIPTKPGYDRDEYPPAVFAENAGAASVQYVPLSDNRSAGQQIKMGITGAPEGCRVTMITGP
ncbi:hypothetical protein MAUB1S_06385 [Mycolicibacterium aubagnense]